MSEGVVDLRQASVTEMLKHLGGLVEAIQRSNERFIRQDRELGEMHTTLDAMASKLDVMRAEMREGFRDVRSDLVAMENRIITAEHKAARSELLPRTE